MKDGPSTFVHDAEKSTNSGTTTSTRYVGSALIMMVTPPMADTWNARIESTEDLQTLVERLEDADFVEEVVGISNPSTEEKLQHRRQKMREELREQPEDTELPQVAFDALREMYDRAEPIFNPPWKYNVQGFSDAFYLPMDEQKDIVDKHCEENEVDDLERSQVWAIARQHSPTTEKGDS